MKVLKLENLSKTFYTEIGELKVLDNINFDVSAGEIVATLVCHLFFNISSIFENIALILVK